jgi:hypothetical protein
VSNIVKTEGGGLVSTYFSPIKEEEQSINPKPRTRDPREHMDTYNDIEKSEKPPLQVDDLYFEWDRTQLRDPRLTPGRLRPPHYTKMDDIPVSLLERLQESRSIYKQKRPEGRLFEGDIYDLSVDEQRHNPWEPNYALYQCYDKDYGGSPTYDYAGFQLDIDHVRHRLYPIYLNTDCTIRAARLEIEIEQSEEEQMFGLFFIDPENAKEGGCSKDHICDHVGKDLGISYMQIGLEQVQLWINREFKPFKYEECWKEPTEEDRRRWKKMTMDSELRKEFWPPGAEPKKQPYWDYKEALRRWESQRVYIAESK